MIPRAASGCTPRRVAAVAIIALAGAAFVATLSLAPPADSSRAPASGRSPNAVTTRPRQAQDRPSANVPITADHAAAPGASDSGHAPASPGTPPSATSPIAPALPASTGPSRPDLTADQRWAVEVAKRGDVDEVRRLLAATTDIARRGLLLRMLAVAPGDDAAWVAILQEAARSDAEPEVRLAAVRALAERRTGTGTAALVSFAHAGADPAVQRAALEGLGDQENAAAVAALSDVAQTPPPKADSPAGDVQALAVAGIAEILGRVAPVGGPEPPPATPGADAKNRDPGPPATARAALRTEAIAALARVLRAPATAATHDAAIRALASTRLPDAVPVLADTAADSHAATATRVAAARALAAIPGPEARRALEDLARRADTPPLVRAQAAGLLDSARGAPPPQPAPR